MRSTWVVPVVRCWPGSGSTRPVASLDVAAWASDGDIVGPLPADARTLVRTPLLGWPAKVAWARLASSLRTLDVGPLAGVTLADWLDAEVRHDSVRRLVELLVRVSSYTNAPDLMSAGAAIAQLRLGLQGVRYLDGGWQSMVASLRAAALALGARVERGEVTSLEHDGTAWTAVNGGRLVARRDRGRRRRRSRRCHAAARRGAVVHRRPSHHRLVTRPRAPQDARPPRAVRRRPAALPLHPCTGGGAGASPVSSFRSR